MYSPLKERVIRYGFFEACNFSVFAGAPWGRVRPARPKNKVHVQMPKVDLHLNINATVNVNNWKLNGNISEVHELMFRLCYFMGKIKSLYPSQDCKKLRRNVNQSVVKVNLFALCGAYSFIDSEIRRRKLCVYSVVSSIASGLSSEKAVGTLLA